MGFMRVKNHGEWETYIPDTPHPDAPPNTIYARRVKDKKDWYKHVFDKTSFDADTIKMTVRHQQINAEGDKAWVVMAATRDVTAIVPNDNIVLELFGMDVSDPQKHFGRKTYDLSAQKFSEDKAY
jgi:hypothetical protein